MIWTSLDNKGVKEDISAGGQDSCRAVLYPRNEAMSRNLPLGDFITGNEGRVHHNDLRRTPEEALDGELPC